VESRLFLEGIAARLAAGRAHAARTPAGVRLPVSYKAQLRRQELAAQFKQELELVGGKLSYARSRTEAQRALTSEIQSWKAERLVSWSLEEFKDWGLFDLLPRTSCIAFDPKAHGAASFAKLCAKAQVGVTTADFGIAHSGTLAIATSLSRPRAVSLLPTVHVALLRESQLVDRLGDAFALYRSQARISASNIHFITGPSRTSDIENDLSIGVHGPAVVSVVLWLDETEQAEASR
jgi:L-lactate dehydrogenase complex protein LldG